MQTVAQRDVKHGEPTSDAEFFVSKDTDGESHLFGLAKLRDGNYIIRESTGEVDRKDNPVFHTVATGTREQLMQRFKP